MSRRDGLHESYCRPSAHAHANIQDHAICRAAACCLGSMLRPYDVLDSTIQQRRAEIRFGHAISSRSACPLAAQRDAEDRALVRGRLTAAARKHFGAFILVCDGF